MNVYQRIGLTQDGASAVEDGAVRFVDFKLAALGCPTAQTEDQEEFHEIAGAILAHHLEVDSSGERRLCPVDERIQNFIHAYLGDDGKDIRLPGSTFILDRHGLARTLSLPAKGDHFSSDIITSYRVRQGGLHNPKSDRRPTQGIFHVTEGG